MHTRHAKSPCCRARVRRYGARRRQCAACRRTWRVRLRKRGRDPGRVDWPLLRRTLQGHLPLTAQAGRYRSITRGAVYRRFRRSLERLIADHPPQPCPHGALVLVADALWYTFDRHAWTLYLLALKPVAACRASLLDPVLLPGGERYDNWSAVLQGIPPALASRIRALVSDDFRPAAQLARERGWVHQLCHFHLIARIQIRRGRRKPNIPGRSLREALYQNVRAALVARRARRLVVLRRRLARGAADPRCPRALRMIVQQFLRQLPAYRAYRTHPTLHLPHTTGAVEAVGRLMRRSSRSLRTPAALERWAIACLRLNPTVTCNGKGETKKHQPN